MGRFAVGKNMKSGINLCQKRDAMKEALVLCHLSVNLKEPPKWVEDQGLLKPHWSLGRRLTNGELMLQGKLTH